MAALVPIWLSIVLLVLTGLSFMPQLARFWTGKGVRDISLFYVFFNLVSATEQFMFLLFFVPLFGDDPFFRRDRDLNDWLSFAQTALVLLMFLVL
ncbi:hypothetical protein SPI_06221 [Niveomyces insectorum RCEF 264]|uniref:Uncharacterized protein n=1 Tax=Niveomyces insectorum RCEF 264 TaxID=1081102 RepID=A0A167RWV0_9HYPO|nr:hypothetical protein SPI_06221 [Niveomyces insectorum RCEF 264]